MLDVLGTLLPAEFVALDLPSGPGAIASRLLRRFPKARCRAVDLDPVMQGNPRSAILAAGCDG